MDDTYQNLSIKELRELARDRGIIGFYLMNKKSLIQRLRGKYAPIYYYLLVLVTFPYDFVIWVQSTNVKNKRLIKNSQSKINYSQSGPEIGDLNNKKALLPKHMCLVKDERDEIKGVWVEKREYAEENSSFKSKLRMFAAFNNCSLDVYESLANGKFKVEKCKSKSQGGIGGYVIKIDE